VPFDEDDAAALDARGTPAGTASARFVRERIATYRSDPAMEALVAAPLHDPLAVAALLDPEVVATAPARCVVETTDPATYGATRFDLHAEDATLEVALGADHARYLSLLLRTF
jgi:inosine-uridine nucleoside N-ribohydrolase